MEKRLIDANALTMHWGFIPYDTGIFQGKFVFAEDVDNAPTFEVERVVVHARWKYENGCWHCTA